MIKSYFNKIKNKYSQKSLSSLDPALFYAKPSDVVGVDAYTNNVIIHRCVSLISTAASHVPWRVLDSNDKDRVLDNHPALQLLKKPSINNSGANFFIENLSNLLLYGNSYILINYNKDRKKFELQNIHPLSISDHIVDTRHVGYKISEGEKARIYNMDQSSKIGQVLHLKNYNPQNPRRGLSSLSSASSAINLYEKIIEWNRSLLNNASKPSGALVFQDGNGYLTDEQFQRLQDQFYENFSGAKNSGKPLILEGGLQWQETGNSERFEKFIELKDSLARDIAVAFNIPPQLLGISGDNTYSNMQEARLALWEENIIPLLDKYSDALSTWLSYWYQEELTVDFDKESISVLTKRREGLWAKIANADFMTINEKRKLVGLPALKNGDQFMHSMQSD